MPDTSTAATDVAVMRCAACGRLDPGPRDLCPACFAPLSPHAVDGLGRLVSWTMIRRPPTAFKAEGAYAVAVVALDAGCKVTGRLDVATGQVLAGTRVRACGRKGTTAVFVAA